MALHLGGLGSQSTLTHSLEGPPEATLEMGQTRRGGSSPIPSQGRLISQESLDNPSGIPTAPLMGLWGGEMQYRCIHQDKVTWSVRCQSPRKSLRAPICYTWRSTCGPQICNLPPCNLPQKMLLGFYQHPLGWKGSQLCLCRSCLLTLNSTHSDSDAQVRYDFELPSNSRAGWPFHFWIQPST